MYAHTNVYIYNYYHITNRQFSPSSSASDEFFATQDKVIGELVQNFHKKLDDFEIDVSPNAIVLTPPPLLIHITFIYGINKR